MSGEPYQTYETGQPWVVYTYRSPDPPDPSLAFESRIEMLCAICGVKDLCVMQVPPRDQEPTLAPGYKHPDRVRFLSEHTHRLQQRAPETWALPLLNPDAHGDTLDILRDVGERVIRTARDRKALP